MTKPAPDEFAALLRAAKDAGVTGEHPRSHVIPMACGQTRAGDRDDRIVFRIIERLGKQAGVEVHPHRRGEYPVGFRPLLRNIYRELRAGGRPDVVGEVPDVLTRFPDLTGEAMLYVGYTASRDEGTALATFKELLNRSRFHREQELVEIFHAALAAPPRSLEALSGRLGEFALWDPHPLVRARALLAWGAHSGERDFAIADEFWKKSARAWRIYPFVAIQDKLQSERNGRYELWSAEGRFLEQLGQSLMAQRLSWRRI